MSSFNSSNLTTTIRLPDLKAIFSILTDGGMNPHCAEVYPEARAWIRSFERRVYGPKMTAFMNSCNLESFTEPCFPYANKERFRAVTDLVNLCWFYDALTDGLTGDQAKEMAIVTARTFREPDFDDGSCVCDVLRDFRRLHLEGKSSQEFTRRFGEHFISFADKVGYEAFLREKQEVLSSLDRYTTFRRESAACRCVLDFVEYALGVELPNHILEDPAWITGYNAAMDLIFLTNDIHSYDMEQGMNHGGANVITVIMKCRNLDVQAAMDYCAGYCEALTLQVVDAHRHLLSHPDPAISTDAARVMEAFGIVDRGQDLWDFTTVRFFGDKHDEVGKTGTFQLRERFGGYPLAE